MVHTRTRTRFGLCCWCANSATTPTPTHKHTLRPNSIACSAHHTINKHQAIAPASSARPLVARPAGRTDFGRHACRSCGLSGWVWPSQSINSFHTSIKKRAWNGFTTSNYWPVCCVDRHQQVYNPNLCTGAKQSHPTSTPVPDSGYPGASRTDHV